MQLSYIKYYIPYVYIVYTYIELLYKGVYMGHKLTTLQQNFVALVILREFQNTPPCRNNPSLLPSPPAQQLLQQTLLTALCYALLLRQVHYVSVTVNCVSVSVSVTRKCIYTPIYIGQHSLELFMTLCKYLCLCVHMYLHN